MRAVAGLLDAVRRLLTWPHRRSCHRRADRLERLADDLDCDIDRGRRELTRDTVDALRGLAVKWRRRAEWK